jgi:hypothetical protein
MSWLRIARSCSTRGAERLVRGDDLVAQAALLAGHLAQVGVRELPRQRELDLGLADQAETHRRLAEAQVVGALVDEDALRLLGRELAAVDEDRAEGRVARGGVPIETALMGKPSALRAAG